MTRTTSRTSAGLLLALAAAGLLTSGCAGGVSDDVEKVVAAHRAIANDFDDRVALVPLSPGVGTRVFPEVQASASSVTLRLTCISGGPIESVTINDETLDGTDVECSHTGLQTGTSVEPGEPLVLRIVGASDSLWVMGLYDGSVNA